MKLNTPREVTIGEATFYIRPFSAFTAANLSGELAGLLLPLLGAFAPLLGSSGGNGEGKSIMDVDVSDAGPVVAGAFSAISGDKLEHMLRSLLIRNRNISVDIEKGPSPELLDEDLVDNLFAGDVQDMFILAFEVIRTNFNGFFKKLGGLFGGAAEKMPETVTEIFQGMASST